METTADERRYVATEQLKTCIREQGRLNQWIARQIGVSDSHFSRVLAGERWVNQERAEKISSILDVDFFVLWKVVASTYKVLYGSLQAQEIPA